LLHIWNNRPGRKKTIQWELLLLRWVELRIIRRDYYTHTDREMGRGGLDKNYMRSGSEMTGAKSSG